MTEAQAIVFVIDDEAAMREALQSLIRSVGLRIATFASAREFLTSQCPDAPACLVLDVRLPGLSGLDLQRELSEAEIHLPIIFITGHGDIPMTVQAMKAGAVEFLTKPFRDQDLLDAISLAIERDCQRRVRRRWGLRPLASRPGRHRGTRREHCSHRPSMTGERGCDGTRC
jgi:FixJ family two-component response regulator